MSIPRSLDLKGLRFFGEAARRASLWPVLLAPVWLGLLCVAMPSAWASDAERAELKAQRAAIEQRFVQAQAACQSRFFVHACVDDARAAQREALTPLRLRELSLDEVERQQRAQQRRVEVAGKQQERQQDLSARMAASAASSAASSAAPSSSSAASDREVSKPGAVQAVQAAGAARAAQTQTDSVAKGGQAAQSAAVAARRVQAAQRRAQATAEAQARVAARLAQRAARGKAVAPLPPGGAPSAPAAAVKPAPAASAAGAIRR